MSKEVIRVYRCALKKKLITSKVVKNVSADFIKQPFENSSKHSKSQEQIRPVHSLKTRAKVFLKELLGCIDVRRTIN